MLLSFDGWAQMRYLQEEEIVKIPLSLDPQKTIGNHLIILDAYVCTGCGRKTHDPQHDIDQLRAEGFVSCCPERHMVPNWALVPPRLAHKIMHSKEQPGMTACWLWTGRLNRNGYGRIRWFGKEPVVHRIIFELFHGPIPDMHVLDHKCEVRNCCNPAHLEPVSVGENTRRGKAVLYKAAHQYAKLNHG